MCRFQWRCCYLQRDITNPQDQCTVYYIYVRCVLVALWSAGLRGDDLWIDSQWFSRLPVSSVGHCCVCPTDHMWTVKISDVLNKTWIIKNKRLLYEVFLWTIYFPFLITVLFYHVCSLIKQVNYINNKLMLSLSTKKRSDQLKPNPHLEYIVFQVWKTHFVVFRMANQ